jgi:hypothetical protein
MPGATSRRVYSFSTDGSNVVSGFIALIRSSAVIMRGRQSYFQDESIMKRINVDLLIMVAAITGVVAMDATTAQAKVRAREAAKAAAVTSTPETTEARQDAHQENQDTRKNRRENASSTEKATAINVAKGRQQKKANAAASVSANRNK